MKDTLGEARFGDLPTYMLDQTEGEHGVKWCHVDMLRQAAGNEAIEGMSERDFRLRGYRQARERMFDEIADILQRFLPSRDDARSSRRGE